MLIEKLLYHARVRATLGRHTRVISSDGVLDLELKNPGEQVAVSGPHTEQLFAAAYAACFLQVMRLVALREGMHIPVNTEVQVSVGVGPTARGLRMEVELGISLPGVPRADADWLVEHSHAICPYSNAVRGNVSVRLVLV